jgi:ABC-2 type transport system permease protein
VTATAELVRMALRRDRVMLPVWIAAFVAVAASSAASVVALYPSGSAVLATAGAVNSTPSLLALYGPLYDASSAGALAVWKPAGSGAALLGLLAMFTVIRHSRTEEETGRRELIGATAIGRGAPLAAALLVATGSVLVIGVLTAVALALTGLPVGGSFAFGAAWAGCGIAFAGVGAVAAQLTRGARAAKGLAVAALVVAFVLRAAGDTTGPAWLSWTSPLGWTQQVRAFAGDRWWVVALPVALGVMLAVVAFGLDAARDLGAGVITDRPGPATGPRLRSPLALAWRLHRGVLAAWTAGFLLFAALLGNLASGVGALLDSPEMQDIVRQLGGQQTLTDAFLATDLGLLGIAASGYAAAAALRLRAEERAGHADAVLAGAVGRLRWSAGHLAFALGGPVLLMAAAGLGAGLAHGLNTGDVGREVPRLVGAALAQLPAVWVVAGVAVALFGAVPRAVAAVWVLLAAFLLVAELGPLVQLPQWALNLSPFTHAPHLPGPDFAVAPLGWLVATATALAVVGLIGFRRRDVG